jgi:phenylalanyl-tRNA synthetase alpha chain
MHDTFFLKTPAECKDFPEEYGQKVKDVHEKGGYGSLGYQYKWDVKEAKKNLLRTHTTAISAQMCY